MAGLHLLVISDPAAPVLKLLDRLPGDVSVTVSRQIEALRDAARTADVVLGREARRPALQAVFSSAPRLRWVHSLSAGVNEYLCPELVESAVPLTNSRGVFSRSLAEFALGAALFFAKDFRRMIRQQAAGVWESFDVEELYGKVLGIVGYGSIGRAVAERGRDFGMRIIAVRRRPDLASESGPAEQILPVARLAELMARSDFVVIATPLTPETRGLVGEAELRAMKPSAVLINVGRGPVVAEDALIRALQQRRIRGAALDVFDREPLPSGHPFYDLDNVLLSPHCADHTPGWEEAAMEVFLDNFERFRKGEPLRNLVDKRLGY
jgi:phosphoglycerate dehydrogenase-like enzyme